MWLIVVLTPLVGLVVLFFVFRKTQDPYGTFHIGLNILPGQTVAKTEWLNMGYWKGTEIFPLACEALALKVIHAAGCKPEGKVLDVGHGSGDSLLLQLTHPSIPRPTVLVGVTSLAEHHVHAQKRVASAVTSKSNATEVRLLHSDAVYRTSASEHPLSPDSVLPRFDSIVAIDCAYHFDTRKLFLEQSFERLAPNGRLALADICFSKPSALISSLLGVPKVNMVCPAVYIDTLVAIGYEDVVLEDITKDVFPGFIGFLKSKGTIWGIFALVIRLIAAGGATFVVVSCQKPNT